MRALVASGSPARARVTLRSSSRAVLPRRFSLATSRRGRPQGSRASSWPLAAFGPGASGFRGQGEYFTHVVKPGENMSFIADDYRTTVEALRLANGLRHASGDVIYEGQRVRVPVTGANRDVVELARERAVAAAERAAAADAAKLPRRPSPSAASSAAAASAYPPPADPKSWGPPYSHMRRGEVTPLTRLEVEAMLPRRGLGSNARLKKPAADVSADALDDLASARAADVLLLVEIPDCEWCAATRPAFRQLAKSRASTDPRATRVCAFEAKTPEDRQWAHKHLAAHSFPTVIALPRRGGVYKYGGDDRSVPFISAFADQAFSAAHSVGAPPRSASAEALSPASPAQALAGAFSGVLARAVGAEAAGVVGVAANAVAPYALVSAGVALFLSAALKLVGGEKSAAARDGRAGSRLDAAGAFGRGGPGAAEVSPRGPPPLVNPATGEPIAPAAAARFEASELAAREARAERRRAEAEARRLSREEAKADADAIPAGASVETLAEWVGMVEEEMGEIARRFAFLVSAWVRLQVRLWRARFAPPPKTNAGGGYEYP